jgi:predicted dinucleotide-utilizing enzyme
MKVIDPIRVGLVGIGRAGWGMHVPELKGHEKQFKIVAACDVLKERRQLMDRTFGCRTYARYEDLLKDRDVELVDIATLSIILRMPLWRSRPASRFALKNPCAGPMRKPSS